MDDQKYIRNMSVIAHVDHGKSTLTDSLVQKAGIISKAMAGDARFTDGRKDEAERGITIKSTGVSMYFIYQDNPYLINLIDSPGHVDFSSEVTAALRVTDGALVVVDCIEGSCVQTETVLRQAISEKIKPVLFLNKLDRIFLEINLDLEDTYIKLRKTVEDVNVILSSYQDEDLGELQLDPREGTVAFGSGYHQWAFTLQNFADMYAPKFKKTPEKMLKYLWGDYFFDPEKNKWTNKNSNGKLKRGFVFLILEPIKKLVDNILIGKTKRYTKMLKKLGITLQEHIYELSPRKIVKYVMNKWLPASKTLLKMIVIHLPSPKESQSYRAKYLYKGPDDHIRQSMEKCDPNGPIVMYVSKMIPVKPGSSHFYAFGRIFSGTMRSGVKLKIMGANYEVGSKRDLFYGSAQQVVTMMGSKSDTMIDIPCGNTCALVGIDKYLIKTGTLCSDDAAYPIRDMKYSVSPIVRVAVTSKKPGDLPKLVEGLKRLSKSDPLVQITMDKDTGENIIAGAGELHLEICVNDLRDFMSGIEIVVTEPVVSYRETIVGTLTQTVLSKSPNKHNRLYVIAEPMPDGLQTDIEEGKVVYNSKDKEQARYLCTEYGYEPYEVDKKRLWGFGPTDKDANMYLNATKGVQYLDEIKQSVMNGFMIATSSGPLCGEPMRGVVIKLLDAVLHADTIHRGMGQILPPSRRTVMGALLSAQPRLQEPMYLCTITVPTSHMGNVYTVISKRRGEVFDTKMHEGTPMTTIKAHVPVAESFGLDTALRAATSGTAFSQCAFSHWQVIDSDPLEEGTLANEIIMKIRKKKDLGELPDIGRYLDRL